MGKFTRLEFLLVAIIWGTSFSFQKVLLENINPPTFVFWNFFVPFLIFSIIVLFKNQSFLYRYKEGITLGVFLSLLEIFQMYGLKYSTAANTVFISNLGMLIIPLLGFILYKHKIKISDIYTLILAAFGMYLLVGGINGFHLGDLYLLCSALAMGLYFLYSEVFEGEKRSHIFTLCAQQFATVSLLSSIFIFFNKDWIFSIDPNLIFTLGWQIIIFTVIPFLLIQLASKKTDDITVAMEGVIEPVVGGIVAWFVFREYATTTMIIGGIIMTLAFAITSFYKRKK